MELQAGKITARGEDVPTTAPTSDRSQIVDEVLTLVNVVAEAAGTILNIQATVDPTVVRALVFATTAFAHLLTR